MEDDIALGDDIAALNADPDSPFRFCKVVSHSGTASVTIDYGGTPVTIAAAAMYCDAFPPDNAWVCVGVVGTSRFILGVRL